MSKLFDDEVKFLSALEKSSVKGGVLEGLCGCGCGGSDEESDSVWEVKSGGSAKVMDRIRR